MTTSEPQHNPSQTVTSTKVEAATKPAELHSADEAAHVDHTQEGHHHHPNLAHHFSSLQQQYANDKLGMWLLLATEILMFGGLFCAYAIYRANHPEVFMYAAHEHLNKWLGATNTVVLLISSFTMAWAVRAAQLEQRQLTTRLLALTLLGGVIFMGIKSVEYAEKFQHDVFTGTWNKYADEYEGKYKPGEKAHGDAEHAKAGEASAGESEGDADHTETQTAVAEADAEEADATTAAATAADQADTSDKPSDSATAVAEAVSKPREAFTEPRAPVQALASQRVNQDLPPLDESGPKFEASLISVAPVGPTGLAPSAKDEAEGKPQEYAFPKYEDLTQARENEKVAVFFGIYFTMTGLHGLHVLIGMGLIGWVMLQNMKGQYSASYFTPVDLVGLYWHLVDLVWIYLFPLLYLID